MLKPRVRFLNKIHEPIYFHPLQWCITNECARLFFKAKSKEGKILEDPESIWGWKEHKKSMDLLYGQIFLDDYNFGCLETIYDQGEKLICIHFDRKTCKLSRKFKMPPFMPLFNAETEDFEEVETPF